MSLDAAHRAFEAGDFAEARRLARRQLAAAPDHATRAAADEILRRTGIDPVMIWLTVGCALMFMAIVFFSLR